MIPQDPQADQQHSRVMLAIVICMLVFWGYYMFFAPKPPPRKPAPPPESTGPSGPTGAEETAAEKETAVVPPPEREVVDLVRRTVQSGPFEVVLSNEGAVIESLTLVHEFKSADGEEKFVLIPVFEKGEGTLALDVEPGLGTWNWEVLETEEGKVGFQTVTDEGVVIRKIITLPTGEDYHFLVDLHFENPGAEERELRYSLRGAMGIVEEDVGYGKEPVAVILIRKNDDLETYAAKKVVEGDKQEWQEFRFLGVQAKYFACLLVPLETLDAEGEPLTLHARIQSVLDEERLRQMIGDRPGSAGKDLEEKARVNVAAWIGVDRKVNDSAKPIPIPPGGALHHRYLFYAGPKNEAILERYNEAPTGVAPEGYDAPGFEELLFTGITGGISKFFVTILAILTKITHNWGISIIILTFLVRAALHPLNRKAQKSLFGMSQLKPQMDAIRQKYKGKKSKETSAKMQREYMALYKEHGVNPLGGCLPMFLQFPVFIGLYWGINQAFELRQAPFFLWIDDLSHQDALFELGFTIPLLNTSYFNLLPILVITTWILQQKMQPKPADPQMQQQQKMMSYMLIFMGFLFYTIPSGLNLYFVTSSTLGMLENRWIKKQLQAEADTAPPVVDPRKKKKRKKKGR